MSRFVHIADGLHMVSGRLLLQDADRFPDDIDSVAKDWQFVSSERPADDDMTNLIFAWKACRAVKSNAIVLAKNSATVGIGIGQDEEVVEAARKANVTMFFTGERHFFH